MITPPNTLRASPVFTPWAPGGCEWLQPLESEPVGLPSPWADAPALIVRIKPEDLSVSLVGRIPAGSLRMLFDKSDLYVTGAPQLRRIANVVGR